MEIRLEYSISNCPQKLLPLSHTPLSDFKLAADVCEIRQELFWLWIYHSDSNVPALAGDREYALTKFPLVNVLCFGLILTLLV